MTFDVPHVLQSVVDGTYFIFPPLKCPKTHKALAIKVIRLDNC